MIETKRLVLRNWRQNDIAAMALINQDPKVMEHFPGLQDLEMTRQLVERFIGHYKDHGYTAYAVEIKETGDFIGFVGLMTPEFDAQFMPTVEIEWRLSSEHWNKGYATEAAQAVLDYAFHQLKLSEVVSFTVPQNKASRRVMEKIGLKHHASDDFCHPNLPKRSPLSRHVLYRITKENYLNKRIGDTHAN